MTEILLLAAFIIANLIAVAATNFATATVITVCAAGACFIWRREIFDPLWNHPEYFIIGGIVYLLIGFVYSRYKYTKMLKHKAKEGANLIYYTPAQVKGDIIGWMFWWPFSMFGYLISDILCDFGNWIYNKVQGYFQSSFNQISEKNQKEKS